MADAWYQTAGEVKALYHQGYNIGKRVFLLESREGGLSYIYAPCQKVHFMTWLKI